MNVLLNGDLTPDQFHRCLAGLNWPEDALVLAFAEDAFRFAAFSGPDEFLVRSDQGRIFHPHGECRWRRLPVSGYSESQDDAANLVRLVYLGQEPSLDRDGLEDASDLLHGLSRVEQSRYLWGVRTDLEPEWIEQQVPHRFAYPVATSLHSRGRIRLVLEEWQGQDGEPVFSRFHHIEETKGRRTMPINEDFWNPYRFVPTRETIQRRPPITDERFEGLSGSVACTLTNLSLLLVAGGDRGQQQFLQRDNRPVLPDSSLKGMLRSLAEIIGGGCFVTSRASYCTDPRNLCVACRMYGMLHRGSVHKGQVSPGDGLLQDEQQARRRNVEIIQGQPKRSHDAFYRHPQTGDVSEEMMKMYFHQPHRTENVPPINLTGPLRHKLGNAKGQGPGSCRIQIQSLTLLPDPARRFQFLGREQVRVLTGADLDLEIRTRTTAFRQDDSPTMRFLRKMMVWDPSDTREFRYPDYNWFRATGNSAVRLKSI